MVYAYVDHLGLEADRQTIRAEALEWSTTRGARSGRTAWQYIQDLAGRLEQRIEG
jgi:predicted AAA+ superfamily ATPase